MKPNYFENVNHDEATKEAVYKADNSNLARCYLDLQVKHDYEIKALRDAFSNLIEVAERCDSWESFPSKDLDAAYCALEIGVDRK